MKRTGSGVSIGGAGLRPQHTERASWLESSDAHGRAASSSSSSSDFAKGVQTDVDSHAGYFSQTTWVPAGLGLGPLAAAASASPSRLASLAAHGSSTREPLIVRDRRVVVDLTELPYASLSAADSQTCTECGKEGAVDPKFLRWFDTAVCESCKREKPEFYGLCTKTEAVEDFLLTADEVLRLPHIRRPNPRNPNWHDMQLFLLKSVHDVAMKKHGGEDGLDRAFDQKRLVRPGARRAKALNTQLDRTR